MPVNSFENYPMSFKPSKESLNAPFYLSLANALEQDIISGKLPPNTLLPPQRELADFLDINLGTVTRAFKLCQLKGLIYAVTGKGTFVSTNAKFSTGHLKENVFSSQNTQVELGLMNPFYSVDNIIYEAALQVMNKQNAVELFRYGSPRGTTYQMEAAVMWMSRYHLNPNKEQISFATGSQNALNIILATLFECRDKIAVDEYTYPSFIGIANLLNIQIIPVKNDEYGMIPDELDKTCRLNNIKGIYLMPSCSNPTSIVLSMDRRHALAKIIKKHDLILIEDDAYNFISPQDYLPFASFMPENTVHISSVSKAISAGLRVAYITYPEKFRSKIISGTYNLNINTPLLNLEIISELILNGDYLKVINKKIELSHKRNLIYLKYFKSYSIQSNPLSLFQCIKLPKGYNSKLYEVKAGQLGIHVLASDKFLVGDIAENPFIRLSICSPDSEVELENALKTLSGLIPEN